MYRCSSAVPMYNTTVCNLLKYACSSCSFAFCTAPSKPVSDVTVTRVNDTAVRVTWTALTLNDARGFPSYVVNVTIGEMEVSTHSTNSTSVVVGGLMPHTEYNVTVQALTAGGTKEGLLSAPGETDTATQLIRQLVHTTLSKCVIVLAVLFYCHRTDIH